MKKRLLFPILLSSLLFAATPEQVEEYLSVSNAEEQLIALESTFASMQRSLNKEENASKTYDMQMLTLRFKEKLASELSEDEMQEVLENYKNLLYLQFMSLTSDESYDPKEAEAYLLKAQQDPDAKNRSDLIDDISKYLYKKEYLSIYFDDLIAPLYTQGGAQKDETKELLENSKKGYIEMMRTEGKKHLLYTLRDFDTEELETLSQFVKRSSIEHETKALYKAMAYALQDYFKTLASRFDPSQHRMQSSKSNHSGQ